VLANYLKNEYLQTVAVVLSKIKSEHAARVLAIAEVLDRLVEHDLATVHQTNRCARGRHGATPGRSLSALS
jgi:flagellar motor switch protein FliG